LLLLPLPADGEEQWEFTVAPYVWMTGIDGDATVRGREADVDVDFSDIWDNLDFAAMAQMEARKGRFGFFLQPNYLKVSEDKDLRLGETETEVESWIVEGGVFWRLSQWGSRRSSALDLLAGGRYWDLSTTLEFTGILGRKVEREKTNDFIDPFVGLRCRISLSDRVQLSLRGDVGGFDLSDDMSDFTWQAVGLLGYDLTEGTTLYGGYRALGIDYEEDSDNEVDLTFQGPLLGVAFRF
jgi:hypothetical protein